MNKPNYERIFKSLWYHCDDNKLIEQSNDVLRYIYQLENELTEFNKKYEYKINFLEFQLLLTHSKYDQLEEEKEKYKKALEKYLQCDECKGKGTISKRMRLIKYEEVVTYPCPRCGIARQALEEEC